MPSKPQATPPSLVVGIGASAGGLAAFKTFLANTPADTGMAFILVQHLDPHHKSLLVELLGAGAAIPVMEAADGMAEKADQVGKPSRRELPRPPPAWTLCRSNG